MAIKHRHDKSRNDYILAFLKACLHTTSASESQDIMQIMDGFPSIKKMRAIDRSLKIDKQIAEDERKFRKECKECKILLLSANDASGLSTIMKQIKIIYHNGFTLDELPRWRTVVYMNLIQCAKDIVLAVKKVGVDWVENVNEVYAKQVLDYVVEFDSSLVLSPDIVVAIESLWKDPVITTVMDHSSEFYFMDSAKYFFSEIRRIGEPHYVPTKSDVLRAEVKTTGITETRISVGSVSIHMVNISGQRSEKRKWIHHFEAVTSILFCVALSEYDQVRLEEKEQNRMAESLVLFELVVNSRWFLRTSIILFLNKIDVFKAKLPKVPLERYFPEYTGGPDINKAAKFILWRFMQVNRARLSVYPHLTQATDTSNIVLVFAAVKETILQNALRDSGIL